ncbi:MAG: HIT family protein [Mycoplasmataceae bacterium]|jgi:histidine triad (HIT) family protein|nr:HIT family protein [Mycoplasmataceae bacterium]
MTKNDCIFCKIANKTIPSKIIYEDEMVLAFLDINPIENGHVLIISKKHFDNFSSMKQEYLNAVMQASLVVINLLKNKLNPDGFNYLSNENQIAGQVVMHFHFHIIPRYEKENKFNKKIAIEEILKILTK